MDFINVYFVVAQALIHRGAMRINNHTSLPESLLAVYNQFKKLNYVLFFKIDRISGPMSQ